MGHWFDSGQVSPNPNLISVYDDAAMCGGTLFLFDPVHSMGSITGVPTDGATIPNAAWRNAARILGAGDATSLAGSFARKASNTDILFERTSKGGLHGMVSQSTQGGTGGGANSAAILLPPGLDAYLATNLPGHQIYTSAWMLPTRAALASPLPPPVLHYAADVTNYALEMFVQAQNQPQTDNFGSTLVPSPGLVNSFRAIAVDHWQGTKPITIPSYGRMMIGWGGNGVWSQASFYQNKCPSFVLYRFMVSDLTVAGITYAQAVARDQAAWVKAFGPGGKFFGDIPSNPSVLIP